MRSLIKKLIVLLICKRLKIDEYELFRFTNQKSNNDVYFFTNDGLWKTWWSKGNEMFDYAVKSTVSFNWLLDDDCKIDIFLEE